MTLQATGLWNKVQAQLGDFEIWGLLLEGSALYTYKKGLEGLP